MTADQGWSVVLVERSRWAFSGAPMALQVLASGPEPAVQALMGLYPRIGDEHHCEDAAVERCYDLQMTTSDGLVLDTVEITEATARALCGDPDTTAWEALRRAAGIHAEDPPW